MAFQKGHTKFTNSGIKKGGKQKKTIAWESIGEYMINEGAERFIDIMTRCNDKEFTENYTRILEYFKPKLARSEHTGADGKELHTTITFK